MKHTVTRQINTYEGTKVVEISAGGIDYTNPGALSAKYPGEFNEFTDPREAVETAIKIAQAWQNDDKDQIFIDHGSTGGMTMFFDGQELNEDTFKELKDWAEELYQNMPKCCRCGEPLGKETWTHELREHDDKFCSENCADNDYWELINDDDDDDDDDDEE